MRRISHPQLVAGALLLIGVSLGAGCLAQARARSVPHHANAVRELQNSSPDTELAGIYAAVNANELDEALRRTDALIVEHPNFRLAYLIRGDLLTAHAKPIVAFGNFAGGPSDRLEDLREEARVRLRAYRDKPPANVVPRYLLQLPPDQRTAVVVDTRRSRLYVYENVEGRPRFLADYYITQGKLGADKLREGDQKTPIGVYHITGRLSRHKLGDFYGPGALPINYPNEWDQLNGRTGHGIWLHGTPTDTYSRPPKASDGCVVLTNQDMRALAQSVQIGITPVIISEDIEWLKMDEWNAERTQLQQSIESWRKDWENRDIDHYLSHYSSRFSSDTEALRHWSERKRQVLQDKQWVEVTVRNLSMLRYPGDGEMVVVTFDEGYRSNNMNNSVKKRQYWVLEAGKWKILYEGVA